MTDLLKGIEQSTPDIDYVVEFAKDVKEKGLIGLSLKTPEGMAQFRSIYSQIWDRLAVRLLDQNAEWREQGDASNKLLGLLEAVYDLKDDPNTLDLAVIAFSSSFNDDQTDGIWSEIFGDTAYYGKNEIARQIESLCVEADFRETYGSPELLAQIISNMTYVLYATHETFGQVPDKKEWLEHIRNEFLR